MHYILLIKLEFPASLSVKVKGLRPYEIEAISKIFDEIPVKYSVLDPTYLEVDLSGVEMLNLLASASFGYQVVGQSMAMEHSDLGGRSFQIEKIVWTLEKK